MYMSTDKEIPDLIPKNEFSVARFLNTPITRAGVDKLQETDYSISEDNLAIRYTDGEIEKSLERLRKEHNIETISMDADHTPYPPGEHFNVFNESITYDGLSEQQKANLLRSVVEELQILQLPLVLAENYVMALLYDTKITATATPANFFYVITYMNMQGVESLNLTTQDKEMLSMGFRMFFGINSRGVIPKEFQKQWQVFKIHILDIGKNPHRRRRENIMNISALTPRQHVEREKTTKKKRLRPLESYAETLDRLQTSDDPLAFLDNPKSPRQVSANIKKRKQRLTIRRKK